MCGCAGLIWCAHIARKLSDDEIEEWTITLRVIARYRADIKSELDVCLAQAVIVIVTSSSLRPTSLDTL